jgi:hypothetical protein
VFETKTRNDFHPSESILNCRSYLKTIKTYSGRQNCNLPKVFLSRRIKKISICIKSLSKLQFTEQNFKNTTLPVFCKLNIKSPLEISHYKLLPFLIDTYINGQKERKNVGILTRMAAALRIKNNQKNLQRAANESNEQDNKRDVAEVKVEIRIATSYLTCVSAPWKVFVEAPIIAGFAIVAPDGIIGKGCCSRREYNLEGPCYTLHRLQQEGEFNFISKNVGVKKNNKFGIK